MMSRRRRAADDPLLLAAAAEAVFGSPDLCAAILRRYSPKCHLRVAKFVLATSSVCHSWQLSVNSASVWKSLCLERWPSTATLPLPPMIDYCHYFQHRALAQAERHRLTPADVFFLLEIRSRATGEVVLSKALCLGQATADPRGPGYCWLIPEMPTHFEDTWSLDGSGFYRRTDGLVHHLDFSLYNRNGATFEWPGEDQGEGFIVDEDDVGSGEESEGEDGEFDDFIDDDNLGGGALSDAEEEEE
eukprot:4533884-Prymnesium_polylepis.1